MYTVFFILIMDEIEDRIHASHLQGSQQRPPPPVDPLQGHAYLEFTPGNDVVRNCRKLKRMHVRGHVAIEWDALDAICEMTRAHYFIPVDSSWDRLFVLSHMPSYRELLVEFLSTFTFHPPRVDKPPAQPQAPPPPHEVSFRFAGVWRALTLAEFAVHSGLYLQDENATDEVVAGADTWEHARAKGRISHEAVRTCIQSGLVLRLCQSPEEREFLYGDVYVTIIAHSLDHLPKVDPHLLPAIEPTRMDFQTMWGTNSFGGY
ncbi:hypothetical protein Hanom_Chr16g01483181 [Helianthus anomalus]